MTAAADEVVYRGARVITVDAALPTADAFWIRDGRFAAVGSEHAVRLEAGPQVRVVDLGGCTVVPGFVDAHLHILPLYHPGSPHEVPDLGPGQVADMAALIRRMRERARHVSPGQWVVGRSYQDTKLGRHPTRHDLDQVSTHHPVRLHHSSFHISVFNTLALRNAGIDRDTPDPEGGSFDRDDDGEPNGIVREGAQNLVTPYNIAMGRDPDDVKQRAAAGPSSPNNRNPVPAVPSQEDMIAALGGRLSAFAARGITSVGIAGISPSDFSRLAELCSRGSPVRIYAMFFDHYLRDAARIVAERGWGDDMLRLGAIKVFHGHSLSGLTAWVNGEYPGRRNYFGIRPKRTQAELDALVLAIQDAGFQAAIHSNGDLEIDMVLTAYERAAPGGARRHRIEHASITTPEILRRARDAGTVLVFHSYMYEHGDKVAGFGPERVARTHPHRSAIDLGVRVAGHSDWPVSAADPLLRIQDLVLRQGADGTPYAPEQCIGVDEALQVMTLGGAYASGEEALKGSISTGKLADFVVLDQDPCQVAPGRIKDIAVKATFVGGRQVHPAMPARPSPNDSR